MHWGEYVGKNDLWFHFARFAEAVRDLDPPAEGFEPMEAMQGNLRVYALKGKKTSLLWCRDTGNTWMTELQDGKSPSVIEGFVLDVQSYLPDGQQPVVSVYDPWRNKWSKATIRNGRISLPEFSRSVVVKITYE